MWLIFIYFILFLHKQQWLECLSKIRCLKNEKKIFLCVHFSMLAGPFKQTRFGGGHQAAISHYDRNLRM
jgi:hypothetical protein